MATVGWFLLSHFCFFATSHQTTLSQIDWRAGFVGRTSNYDNSNFISGMLVIINTFGGQILFMVLYGLLSSFMFSLFALFPDLLKAKSLKDKTNVRKTTLNTAPNTQHIYLPFDITRGELVIYEYESVFLGSVFKLAVQLMILHGLRVSFKNISIMCYIILSFSGIMFYDFVYDTLSALDGLEDFCTKIYL